MSNTYPLLVSVAAGQTASAKALAAGYLGGPTKKGTCGHAQKIKPEASNGLRFRVKFVKTHKHQQ